MPDIEASMTGGWKDRKHRRCKTVVKKGIPWNSLETLSDRVKEKKLLR